MKRILICIMVALTLVFSGCANVGTAVDQQAIHESGGALTNPEIKNCVEPGTRERQNFFGESFYYYPAGARSWLFDDSSQSDTDSYQVLVKSPVAKGERTSQAISLTTPGEATMTLTNDCELLKEFHKDYGRKYTAYVTEGNEQPGAGWDNLLNAKFSPALQNGLNTAFQDTSYDLLVSDVSLRTQIQDEVAKDTLTALNRSLGADYFTDVQVTLFQPRLPESIQRNIEQNEAAKQFNEKVLTEIETMKDLVDILGPNGYILYKALQDGNIKVLPVPQGSGVSIPNN